MHLVLETLRYSQMVQHTAAAAVPVHAGVRAVVVEGVLRADAALLTLDAAVLRDGEGGAATLAG